MHTVFKAILSYPDMAVPGKQPNEWDMPTIPKAPAFKPTSTEIASEAAEHNVTAAVARSRLLEAHKQASADVFAAAQTRNQGACKFLPCLECCISIYEFA